MVTEKVIDHPDFGVVKYQKKRGLKRISMRLHDSGEIRVSLPYHVPWIVAEQFVKSHDDWIIKQKSKHQLYQLIDGQQIGKSHKLVLNIGPNLRTYVRDNLIKVSYASSPNELETIITAKKAIKRALSIEANDILPERLEQIANMYGYEYKSIKIKPMKTRWGVCDSRKNITLNCYLMELSWPLIDYVIAHELAHTKHMNHSHSFWQEVSKYSPNYKELKKQLKEQHKNVRLLYV